MYHRYVNIIHICIDVEKRFKCPLPAPIHSLIVREICGTTLSYMHAFLNFFRETNVA